MKHDRLIVPPNTKISLAKDYDPGYTGDYKNKTGGEGKLKSDVARLAAFQDILYCQRARLLR